MLAHAWAICSKIFANKSNPKEKILDKKKKYYVMEPEPGEGTG